MIDDPTISIIDVERPQLLQHFRLSGIGKGFLPLHGLQRPFSFQFRAGAGREDLKHRQRLGVFRHRLGVKDCQMPDDSSRSIENRHAEVTLNRQLR